MIPFVASGYSKPDVTEEIKNFTLYCTKCGSIHTKISYLDDNYGHAGRTHILQIYCVNCENSYVVDFYL